MELFTKMSSAYKQAFQNSCANLSALASTFFYRWSRKYRNYNMASSRAALSSSQFTPTQPRLHGACILPGHILVNERFHESDVVKTLQGNDSNVFLV